MAKIWIPKSWSGTNPPASGTRVFVGGKGGGKAVYETLSTGQTKRCLQSNGKGSIFYGNVTIADPTKPSTSSDVNLGGVNSIQSSFDAKTSRGQYGEATFGINGTVNNGYITGCSIYSITNPILSDDIPATIAVQARSGYSWSAIPSDLKLVKKISIQLTNGLYIVYFVTYRQDLSRGVSYTVEGFYTNINANVSRDAQAQMRSWFTSQPDGYLCLNKTR